MNFCNRFKVLEESDEEEDYEDIAPYNKIVNTKWSSLYCDAHPIRSLIQHRFSSFYSGKLFWFELNKMKKIIDDRRNKLSSYEDKVEDHMSELKYLIREEKKLCYNDSSCAENLKKHLVECQSKYKCTETFLSQDCWLHDNNGRCCHYFKIENSEEDLGRYECIIYEDKESLYDLEVDYEKALATKENRLDEYYQEISDNCDDYFYMDYY